MKTFLPFLSTACRTCGTKIIAAAHRSLLRSAVVGLGIVTFTACVSPRPSNETASGQGIQPGVHEVGTEEVYVSAPTGQLFGSGFNSLKASPFAGHALINNPQTEQAMPENGFRAMYSLKVSEQTRDLLRSFRGSASAAYGAFADASFQTVNNANLHSYCVSAVADITVYTGAESISPASRLLSPSALKRLKDGGIAEFTSAFGNAYLQSVTRGGRLFALLTVRTQSKDERKKVAAAFDAGVGLFSSSGQFESKTKSALKNHHVEVRGFQFGGKNPGTFASSLDEFLKKANGFAGEVKESSVVLLARIAPYNTCVNYPPLSHDQTEVGAAAWLARELGDYQRRCTFALSDVAFAALHPDLFSNATPARVGFWNKELSSQRQRAEILELQIRNNPSLRPTDVQFFLTNTIPTVDEMFDSVVYQDIEVPFTWNTTGRMHRGGRWIRLAGEDDNINSKDDRNTGLLLRSSVVIRKGEPVMSCEFKVTEREHNQTTLGGNVEQSLPLPPPYNRNWQVKQVISGNDLSFTRNYKKERHRHVNFSKEEAVKESYWNNLLIRYDTEEGNDSRAIGFQGNGTIMLRVVPK